MITTQGTTHPARYWLDRAIRQVQSRPMSLIAYARAWCHIIHAQILIGDVRIDARGAVVRLEGRNA